MAAIQSAPTTVTPPPTPTPLRATAPATAPAALPSISGVNLTPTNPANDLRGQTITPGATADRYAVAQDRFKTFADATLPYYAQGRRDTASHAAGAGQIGSGQFRLSLGNAENVRNLQLDTARDTFLQNALEGSIDDTYKNVAQANQQQQYQTGAQNQTYQQMLQALGLGDSLQNSAVNRAATQYQIGASGNPASTQLAVSNQYGQNASNASNALGGLINGTVANTSAQNSQQSIQDLLRSIGVGTYNPSATPTGTPANDILGGVYG